MNNEKFLAFVNYMFHENCLERFEHREKEYPNSETYLKKNKEFLERKFLEK